MKPGVVWIGSLLAFPLAGAPLLAHSAFRGFGRAARFALAAGAGVFVISTTMTFLALARVTWSLPLLVAAGFVECLALRLALRGAPAPVAPERRRLSGGERVAAGSIVVSLFAAAGATAAATATSTDLLLFWGPKAAAFAAARGMDAEYLADHLHRYQHASYPPLVPDIFAFATVAAGTFSWMAAAATFPIVLAVLAAALPGLLRRFSPTRDALFASAAIAASLGLAGHALMMAGNADPFLLFFEVLSIAVLLGAGPDDRASHLAAGLLLGGAAAAKVEGLPFVLCAAAFYLALRGRPYARHLRRSVATAVRLLAPAALALAGWFAFGRQRAVFLGYESYGPALDIHWGTLGHVLSTTASSLASAAMGLPWLVPAAAFAAALAARTRPASSKTAGSRDFLYPAAIAAVLSVFFVFTYLHGPDPTLLIEWSAGRIFLIVSPLLTFAAIARGAPRAGSSEEA